MFRIDQPQEEAPQDRRKWYIGGALAALVLAGAGFIGVGPHPPTVAQPRYVAWEAPRPFIVNSSADIRVRAEPDSSSQILVELPEGSVYFGLGERVPPSDSLRPWRKLKTRSETVGWCRVPCGQGITLAEAEELILREQQVFEEFVRQTVFNGVQQRILQLALHTGTPDDIQITAPLSTTESSAGFHAPVTALMHGAVLGSNKYEVKFDVHLFMHVNKDFLAASTVEVDRVDLLSNERTSGIGGLQAVKILSGLGFF